MKLTPPPCTTEALPFVRRVNVRTYLADPYIRITIDMDSGFEVECVDLYWDAPPEVSDKVAVVPCSLPR